ncbi:MAG: hypothetical protein ACJAZ2_001150 [Glaciecola sp.]|jgi:hypothetical protein
MESKTKKHLPLSILFASMHLVFVLHLHHESCKAAPNHFLLLPILLLPFYFLLSFDKPQINAIGFIKNTLAFSIGFVGTIYLQNYFSTVIASALLATMFVLLSEIKSLNLTSHQAAVYAGTFGGMVSTYWLPNNVGIAVSCVLGGVLFSLFNSSLTGFGGKLGSIGFGSVIIWILVQW